MLGVFDQHEYFAIHVFFATCFFNSTSFYLVITSTIYNRNRDHFSKKDQVGINMMVRARKIQLILVVLYGISEFTYFNVKMVALRFINPILQWCNVFFILYYLTLMSFSHNYYDDIAQHIS